MICNSCQNEITDQAKFCKFCGKEVSVGGYSTASKGSVDLYFQNKNVDTLGIIKKSANGEILKGIGLIILGIVVTMISYSMAGSGGRYFIFWGISIYGLYVFSRGVYYRLFPKQLIKK